MYENFAASRSFFFGLFSQFIDLIFGFYITRNVSLGHLLVTLMIIVIMLRGFTNFIAFGSGIGKYIGGAAVASGSVAKSGYNRARSSVKKSRKKSEAYQKEIKKDFENEKMKDLTV